MDARDLGDTQKKTRGKKHKFNCVQFWRPKKKWNPTTLGFWCLADPGRVAGKKKMKMKGGKTNKKKVGERKIFGLDKIFSVESFPAKPKKRRKSAKKKTASFARIIV